MKDPADCLILIVDDTEESVDVLVEALGDIYDIAVALDGETALEVAAEEHPDLILLDIVMPGMNGFEVFERLRAGEATRGIPVMFLSGQSEASDHDRAESLGAAGFLTKPVDVQALRRTVEVFLRQETADHREETDG